jgi:predicted flap endonuclease-1-like 5' DNA nuclease
MNLADTNRPLLNLLAQAADQQGGLPWWARLLIIIVIILIVLLLWWLLRRPEKEEPLARLEPPVERQQPIPAVASPTPATPVPPAPAKPDDLTIIEGIGPKIASVLQAAGITTFSQLATADLARVSQILKDAGLHLADPGTWAQQASLAAAGKLDELKVLQDSLKGGRQV